MKRLFVIYNPHSSRFAEVKKDVLDQLVKIKGYAIGKYEVDRTNVDKNTAKLAKLLKNGDILISAGGDATGIIASNGILKSNKDATLAVLPYGNFNDLARTLVTELNGNVAEGGALVLVNVGSADTCLLNLYKHLVVADFRNGKLIDVNFLCACENGNSCLLRDLKIRHGQILLFK